MRFSHALLTTKSSRKVGGSLGVFIILGFFLLIPILLASWTEKSLEFWLTFIKGSPVDVPYWMAFILTFLTNVFGIIFNLVTELLKLAL